MNRTERFDRPSPTGSTRTPSIGCPSTSMPSCAGPARSDSDRHGRASKGGSPWIPRPLHARATARAGSLAPGRPGRAPSGGHGCGRRLPARLPAPFGLARDNGAIVVQPDGDISAVDRRRRTTHGSSSTRRCHGLVDFARRHARGDIVQDAVPTMRITSLAGLDDRDGPMLDGAIERQRPGQLVAGRPRDLDCLRLVADGKHRLPVADTATARDLATSTSGSRSEPGHRSARLVTRRGNDRFITAARSRPSSRHRSSSSGPTGPASQTLDTSDARRRRDHLGARPRPSSACSYATWEFRSRLDVATEDGHYARRRVLTDWSPDGSRIAYWTTDRHRLDG